MATTQKAIHNLVGLTAIITIIASSLLYIIPASASGSTFNNWRQQNAQVSSWLSSHPQTESWLNEHPAAADKIPAIISRQGDSLNSEDKIMNFLDAYGSDIEESVSSIPPGVATAIRSGAFDGIIDDTLKEYVDDVDECNTGNTASCPTGVQILEDSNKLAELADASQAGATGGSGATTQTGGTGATQPQKTTSDSPSSDAALTWTPNVSIGGFTQEQPVTISADRNILGEYISIWYKFLVGIAGLLATIMVIMGGVTWLTSGGSSAIIGDAKKTISSALIGLTLALLSYVLLQVINPNLTTINMPTTMGNITYQGDYKMLPAEFQTKNTSSNTNNSNSNTSPQIQPTSDAQSFADSMAKVYSSQANLELTQDDINSYKEYADDFYNLSIKPKIQDNPDAIVYPTNITQEILSENANDAYKIFNYYNLSWDKYNMELVSSNGQSLGNHSYNALIFTLKK